MYEKVVKNIKVYCVILTCGLQVISRIYKACQNYSTWKSSHNPGHKPWLYPEQMSLPRLDLQDIQAECEFTSNESLDESNVKEEDIDKGYVDEI